MQRPRILFASWHNYLDQTNGAAISTRALLLGLARRGWSSRAFCGTSFDGAADSLERNVENRPGLAVCSWRQFSGTIPYRLLNIRDNGTGAIVFAPDAVGDPLEVEEKSVGDFLSIYRQILMKNSPDLVMTYGGGAFRDILISTAREFGARTCVLLQNFSYDRADYFKNADLVVVPSEFSRRFHVGKLGIASTAIPPLIRMNAQLDAVAESRTKKEFVLFVNPNGNKGVFWFAGLARALASRRPDIRFLVVEGSSGLRSLRNPLLKLRGVE